MKCLICNLNLDDYKTCQVKCETIQKLIERSIVRKDNLADSLRGIETIRMHKECRRKYKDPRNDHIKNIIPYSLAAASARISCQERVEFEYIPFIRNTSGSQDSVTNPLTTNTSLPENTTYGNESEHFECNLPVDALIECDSANDGTKSRYLHNVQNSALKLPNIQTSDDNATKPENKLEIDLNKPFPFQYKCFFCAEDLMDKEKYPQKFIKNQHSSVSDQQMQEKIIHRLSSIPTPDYVTVLQRIQHIDLVQVKASYHKKCYVNCINIQRPPDEFLKLQTAAMEQIYGYIDKRDDTDFTKAELISASNGEDNLPDWRVVQRKLKERYEGKIYFTGSGFNTIVTVIKETGSGLNRFTQPWNLNGIDLGGQIVEDCNTKHIKPRRLATKTQMETEADRKTNKEKKDEETIEEEIKETQVKQEIEDNDVHAKRKTRSQAIKNYTQREDDRKTNKENEDEEEKEKPADDTKDFDRNMLACRICFSSDRKLGDLGKYCDVFQKLCSDVEIQYFETKLFLICWECKALLRNIKYFQEKIRIAQKYWKNEIQTQPNCQSTLRITNPDVSSLSNKFEKQTTMQNKKTHQECVQPELIVIDINLPPEEHVKYPPIKIEKDEMNNEAFKNEIDDMDSNDDEDHHEENNTGNDTFSNEPEDMNCDGNSENHQRDENNINNNTFDNESKDTITDKDPTKQVKSKNQRAIKDPDWGTDVREKRPKIKKKPTQCAKLKIPYTVIVQTYITETKMKRERIDPHNLLYWLDTERKSDYFQNSKRKRCVKCVTEVADNHDELCHSEKYPYICDICESTFASKEEQELHEANHYYIFSCEFCPYKCYNQTHMRCHVESHRRLVQCLECFAAFQSFDLLAEHYGKLHRHAECGYCGQKFPHKSSVITHIKSNHTPKKCSVCNITLKAQRYMKHHMRLMHHVDRTEASYCVQCDIQFDNKAKLKNHIKSSPKHSHEWDESRRIKKKHKCPDCPKTYSSHYYMKCHFNLAHSKKANFSCEICDKAFTRNAACKRHVKEKHEGYKQPKNKICHLCGRGFTTNAILRNHIRTHTGERPFACPHCASTFAQITAMQTHIAHVHEKRPRTSGAKPCTKRQSAEPREPSFLDYDF